MTQNSITGLIYDAIVDPTAVPVLAQALASHMHADTNWMLIGVNADKSPAAMCVHGIDDDFARAYEEHFYQYDPWLDMVGKVPSNVPVSLERWVSTQQFQSSVVYQELVRGRVDIMHCLGLVFRDGASYSTLALQRGKGGSSFDEADEKLLKPYLSHLRRYVTATIRKATIVPHDLEMLVAHPDPVIVVDHTACMVHSSLDGAALIGSGTVLGRTPGGRLYSIDKRLALEAAVRLAALKGVPTVQQVDPPGGSHIIAVDPCGTLLRHASITIRNRQHHAKRKVDEAANRFDLTEREKRLLSSLLMGRSLEEHCVCHGIVVSTARSQLRSVFGKAGVQRQSELMVQVLATPTH